MPSPKSTDGFFGWIQPEYYIYSSALDYSGGKGLLKIELIGSCKLPDIDGPKL